LTGPSTPGAPIETGLRLGHRPRRHLPGEQVRRYGVPPVLPDESDDQALLQRELLGVGRQREDRRREILGGLAAANGGEADDG